MQVEKLKYDVDINCLTRQGIFFSSLNPEPKDYGQTKITIAVCCTCQTTNKLSLMSYLARVHSASQLVKSDRAR